MGILSSKIDYKLLEECERYVSQIDTLASSLGESIDSVHTTLYLLLKRNSETGNAISRNHEVKVLKELLGSVERGLCFQKLAFLEALNSFASFLLKNKDSKANIRALKDLTIDTYLKEFRETQTSRTTPDAGQAIALPTNDGAVPGKTLSMTRQNNEHETLEGLFMKMEQSSQNINDFLEQRDELINSLKKTDEQLNDNNNQIKSEVQTLNRLSQELISKNKSLEDQNRNLSKELNNLKTNTIKDLEQTLQDKIGIISKMKTENDRLKDSNLKLLEQLTRKTENVQVQIFMQRKVDLLSLIESDLLRLISKHPMFENKELKIVRPECPDEITGNHPTLVLCLHGSRLGTDAKSEVQNIREPGKTALLIFHYKDEHALPSQTSDGILTAAEFKALGGIFDLAFLKEKGIYDCNMNNFAASNIIKFILNSNSQ